VELLILLAAFAAGLFFGKKKKMKYDFLMMSTVVLLFIMGYEIGNNKDLFDSLPSIGWISLLLALAAIFGSVFLTNFVRFLKKDEK
jgi:uncharacterized membrane protein YbjE (DUF340 family)